MIEGERPMQPARSRAGLAAVTESDEKIARGKRLAERRAALRMSQTQLARTVQELAGPTEMTLRRETILRAEQGSGSEDTFRYYEAWLSQLEKDAAGMTAEERSELVEAAGQVEATSPFTMTVRIGALDWQATVSGELEDADLIREQMTKLMDAAMRRTSEKPLTDRPD